MSLTKTTKKGRQIKDTLIADIRDSVDKFAAMYVFRFDGLRTTHMADVRQRFINGRCARSHCTALPPHRRRKPSSTIFRRSLGQPQVLRGSALDWRWC